MGIELCTRQLSQADLSNQLWDHPVDLIRVFQDLEVYFYQTFCIQGLKTLDLFSANQKYLLASSCNDTYEQMELRREKGEGQTQWCNLNKRKISKAGKQRLMSQILFQISFAEFF